MAILQAIIFAVYQFELTILYAYFPEIVSAHLLGAIDFQSDEGSSQLVFCERFFIQGRDVGEEKMNSYTTTWYANQFTSQASVNLVLILISVFLRPGSVKIAMISQAITALMCAVFLTLCWRLLPARKAKLKLPKGTSLAIAGFKQNWYLGKKIWQNYKGGLRWFLLSTIFAEAAASAIGSTAVIFLSLHLRLSASKIGIFFEVSLIGVIAGTKVRIENLFCLTYYATVLLCWIEIPKSNVDCVALHGNHHACPRWISYMGNLDRRTCYEIYESKNQFYVVGTRIWVVRHYWMLDC